MKLLSLLTALGLSAGAFAESMNTNISNLNYFVGAKKFNFAADFGYSTATEEDKTPGATDEDTTGYVLTASGNYGIANNHYIGVDVAYTNAEIDQNTTGTANTDYVGLNDINLRWGWRYMTSTDWQADLLVGLSPKLGANEIDTAAKEVNAFRGNTMFNLGTNFYTSSGNLEWTLSAGINYFTKTEVETDNGTTTTTTDYDPSTDFYLGATTRWQASPMWFLGGGAMFTAKGDVEEDAAGVTGASAAYDLTTDLMVEVGYKLDTMSNITFAIDHSIGGYTDESSTPNTDYDTTETAFVLGYSREI